MTATKAEQAYENCLNALTNVKSTFPTLKIDLSTDHDPSHISGISISLEVPEQSLIKHKISCAMQEDDEFHIYFCDGHFSFSPCDKQEVTNLVADILIGLISGDYRCVRYHFFGLHVASKIQVLSNHQWQTVATYFNGFNFIFKPVSRVAQIDCNKQSD